MTTYQATVMPDDRFWFVQVNGVGATQARHLFELEAMTIDMIEIKTGHAPNETEVDYRFEDLPATP